MSELKIIDLKLNNNYVQDLINNKPNLQDDKLLKINVLKNNLRNKIIGNQITKTAVIHHFTHTVNCKCNNSYTIKVEPENIYSKYYDCCDCEGLYLFKDDLLFTCWRNLK